MLVLCKSTGEEDCRALSLKRAHLRRPEVTSHYLGQPEGRGRGKKLLVQNYQQLEQEMSTSYKRNAEGAYNEKIALVERLHEENIEVACPQEAHLIELQHFNIKEYQVFRQDRENRTKGGVAILGRNSMQAQDFRVSTNNQAEIHGVAITLENQQISIFNAYFSMDRGIPRGPHGTTRQPVPCARGQGIQMLGDTQRLIEQDRRLKTGRLTTKFCSYMTRMTYLLSSRDDGLPMQHLIWNLLLKICPQEQSE